jgi:hypothetical protein
MKLIVAFLKPYGQMTLEEGKNIKDCIRKALVHFDKNFISGCDNIEDIIENNASLQMSKDKDDRQCFYYDYTWDVAVYDFKTDTIFNATWVMKEIANEITAELQKRWKAGDRMRKMSEYTKLKKELEIE